MLLLQIFHKTTESGTFLQKTKTKIALLILKVVLNEILLFLLLLLLSMWHLWCSICMYVSDVEVIIKAEKTERKYRISSYKFRGNYSFFNFEIVGNSNSCYKISIFNLINWFFAAETIQGRKLFKGGSYSRKYGI